MPDYNGLMWVEGGCTLGWDDFALFLNFMQSHGFVVPLGTIWGTTKFFSFWFKRSIFSKKVQGAKNKKNLIFSFGIFFLFNAYMILKENKILNKTSF